MMVEKREIDISRLQKIGMEVVKLLEKRCYNPIEGMYVLKASLYILKGVTRELGICVENETEIDFEIIKSIDESIGEAMEDE